jgi:polyisoprenoid-binding protein YceI
MFQNGLIATGSIAQRVLFSDKGEVEMSSTNHHRFVEHAAKCIHTSSPLRNPAVTKLIGCPLHSAVWFMVLLLFVAPAWADWTLNNAQSQLSFVSIKKGDIAEVHRFDQLDGSVDGKGNVKLTIQLASVDTAIPIRDQRMREMLFETSAFPSAVLTATIDASEVNTLDVGDILMSSLKGQLSLHGQSGPVTAELAVARLGPKKLLVSSRKPMVLQVADYELLGGVDKLREVAGLDSISKAVPVSFVLTFDKN